MHALGDGSLPLISTPTGNHQDATLTRAHTYANDQLPAAYCTSAKDSTFDVKRPRPRVKFRQYKSGSLELSAIGRVVARRYLRADVGG